MWRNDIVLFVRIVFNTIPMYRLQSRAVAVKYPKY